MKVYIDGLFYKGAGIGRYYETLVRGFVKRGVAIYTCVPLKYRKPFEVEFKNYGRLVSPIYVNYSKFSIKGFFKQSKTLKELEGSVSLYHFPQVNLPLYVPRNTIVTIHDLIPLTSYWGGDFFKRSLFKWYLKRAISLSIKVVAISMETKRHLCLLFATPPDKIVNIYNGVSKKFLSCYSARSKIRPRWYILYVGNRKKHKNLTTLVKAFDIIQKRLSNIKLVIAGSKDKNLDEVNLLIEKMQLKDSVVECLAPKDEKILELYKYAEILVLPSFFEGFGITPLEAMAMGTPAAVSKIPVLKEIYDKSVVFFDPYRAEDMAEKICRVMVNNGLRRKLIKNGRKKAELFSEDRCVEEYIKLYKEIMDEYHESSTTRQVLSS